MNTSKQIQPAVWPEPNERGEFEKKCIEPPFEVLVQQSRAMFGMVSAITSRGIDELDRWLKQNTTIRLRLIVGVYPACLTGEAELEQLNDLSCRAPDRLKVHVYSLSKSTERFTNAFCFLSTCCDRMYIVTGPSEDFGIDMRLDGHINFVVQGEPTLVDSFRHQFDYYWSRSLDISAPGATLIPALELPKGTYEASAAWAVYQCLRSGLPDLENDATKAVTVDGMQTEVSSTAADEIKPVTATEEIGFKSLDPIAGFVSELYSKGSLVSIDKLSRIPPLDAPLDPSLFGDPAELHFGNVVRKVSMRVSIIDEKTLKQIEKSRQGMRTLLTKFTFGLADNIRWMPDAARELFELEVKRLNENGQKIIADLLNGDVEKFIDGRKAALIADIEEMFAKLGRPGQSNEEIIEKTVESLRDRLEKAMSANFMPTVSFSSISFDGTENSAATPWGQAYTLLADVAAYPRKAYSDKFFFRGIRVSEDDLLDAMNVADDVLLKDTTMRGLRQQCKSELELLTYIESSQLSPKQRCELVMRLLTGDAIQAMIRATKAKIQINATSLGRFQ